MVKGIGRVYNHSQHTCPYTSKNTALVVPQRLLYTTPYVTTGGSFSSMDDIIQTRLLSSSNTMNKLDLAVNIYNKSQYF